MTAGLAPSAASATASSSAADGPDPTAGLLQPFALPAPLRERFEDSLGVDLGGVRLHTDDDSAADASAMGARAFATGSNIHFAAGQYRPDDPFGQHLIAHEVAHTVQQSSGAASGVQLKPDSGAASDANETKADTAADAMVDGVTEEDKKFAAAFAAEFADIKSSFPDATAEKLCAKKDPLLSPWQRKMVSSFIATRKIPDSLFTGEHATGKVSTAQKILMSGHILATGTTGEPRPGDAPTETGQGKVRALNCGRWAEYVWIYAGVNSAKGDPSAYEGTLMGATGPTGQISFGGGGPNQHVGPHGTKANDAAANLEAGQCLQKGTGKLDALGQGDPAKVLEYLEAIRPGDWIWIDHGGAGGHSEIFVEWTAKPERIAGTDKVKGVATVFHQGVNEDKYEDRKKKGKWAEDGGGGLKKDQVLGYPRPDFPTVTMIERPAADAGPPRTAEQLLQYDRAKAAAANEKHVAKKKIVLATYHAAMGNAASARLGESDNYEPALRTLCAKIRSDAGSKATIDNLTLLIALVQRMSPTNKKTTSTWKEGQPVTGVIDPDKAAEIALVPGGLGAITKAAE